MSDSGDSTRTSALLAQWAGGDRQALDELLSHLYRDIHAIAVIGLHRHGHVVFVNE